MDGSTLPLVPADWEQMPAVNVPFSMQDPDIVWIVQEGRLDLFLVRTRGGELMGARAHVLRVQEGEAAFGMPPDGGEVALVAIAGVGTRLLRLPRRELERLAEAGLLYPPERPRHASYAAQASNAAHAAPALGGVSDVARGAGHPPPGDSVTRRLLESWIRRLTAALGGDVVHGAFTAVPPGATVTVGDDPRAVVPADDVAWVTIVRGRGAFLGRELAAAAEGGPRLLPITRHAWLMVQPESAVAAIDTRAFLRTDGCWADLDAFHARVMTRVARKYDEDAAREHRRARERVAFDNRILHASLQLLRRTLRPKGGARDELVTSTDPLYLAFRAIAAGFGIELKPPPDPLRNALPADPVESLAYVSGIRVRRVALTGTWWKQGANPLLVFRAEDQRPLALLPRADGRMDRYDPVEQRTQVLTASGAATLGAFGYVVYRPFPPRPIGAMDLLRHSLPNRKWEITAILCAGVATGALGLVAPIATGIAFDHLIPASDKPGLLQISLFLFLVSLASALIALVGSFASLRLQGIANASLQAALWDRLLNLPAAFFRQFSSGELSQRGLGISGIQDLLANAAMTVFMAGIFAMFSFGLLFYYSARLALIATGLAAIAVLVTMACGLRQWQRQRDLLKIQARVSSLLLQLVGGIAKFRVSGTEKRAFAAWAEVFAKQKKVAMEIRSTSRVLGEFNAALPIVSALALFYSFSMYTNADGTQMTTGAFLAFMAAFSQFLGSSLMLGTVIVQSLGVFPLYEMAKPILEATPEVAGNKITADRLTGAVEISHVSFRYGADGPLVLNDINLSIQPGEFIAVVGASGSGKSTLMRLLLGFESPSSGALYFDGQDLSKLDIQAVRRQFGVVLQSGRPVNASILKNITGSAPLTIQDAWDAASLAGLADEIRAMPMGMHTHVSDAGGNLSGGQRQRLLIARAVVGRPRILLFDEATSALDNHSQAVVSRSLEGLQVTRIVIAHRLSTIINADRIYVIEKGSVVQVGSYKALVEAEGPFRDLVRRQMI